MPQKKIALVAHDNKKSDLLDWARFNRGALERHRLFATGTTGKLVEDELGLRVARLQSGPLGGDQQVGSKIVKGDVDFLIFFWDTRSSLTHTIRMLKPFCASRWSGTSRLPAIGPQPTSSSHRR